MDNKLFPNGFSSWQETHFEIVSYIKDDLKRGLKTMFTNISENQGTGGLYEIAEELTDKFEKQHKGREWDGDFFDEIESFMLKESINQNHNSDYYRFEMQDLDEEVNIPDLKRSADSGNLFGIVDDKAGGIIAYTIGLDHTKMIVETLNNNNEMLNILQRVTNILELEQGESLESMAAKIIIKKATLN